MIIKNAEMAVQLKYLSNSWRTLEMLLINCEISLILTWSKNCIVSSATGETEIAITDSGIYVPVVTSSTQDKKNCFSNLNQNFNAHLTRININQK